MKTQIQVNSDDDDEMDDSEEADQWKKEFVSLIVNVYKNC